jgi:ABC-type phosphate/phosphonate transport system substrate-binding protein
MRRIAALPMYNVTPGVASDWRALIDGARSRLSGWLDARGDRLDIVEPGDDLTAFWLRDDLLFSQTCGYPLVHALRKRVQLVATPVFDVPGCAGGMYRSVLVVGSHVAAESLEACRGLRAVYNSDDSNSGMNLFRHAVAPLARDGRFFTSVTRSGGHLASLRALAVERSADVAAIDCVTLAFVRDHLPELAAGVREIGVTASTAALPFIASNGLPEEAPALIADALTDTLAADPGLAARLKLEGFVRLAEADYATILRLEEEAAASGYPRLA